MRSALRRGKGSALNTVYVGVEFYVQLDDRMCFQDGSNNFVQDQIASFMCEIPEYMAQGILKLLEDRINGSILMISKNLGTKYIGFQEEFKNVPLE
ncbi:hypothetical protein CEXT_268811 [Caerostris extrusa]|uniref:Uncharacterized protein n=1 Tax=Caerostris extrusa TaxID=172846 RepID=A0AAV4Q046_CAEEX|nr:hypothetical protein CEXT_268811 [Caerostris extrusa]